MNRKEWIWIALLGLLAVGIALAYRLWPRQLAPEQCSELFRRYAEVPGVTVAYISDKRINDTVSVSVTILQATDSATFAELLKAMGKSEDVVTYMTSSTIKEDARFTGLHLKGHPEIDSDTDILKNDMQVLIPSRRLIATFHYKTMAEYRLLLEGNLKEKIKIQEP